MQSLKLDSIMLFTLVTAFVMGYRFSPFETQQWLFGCVLLGLFLYLCLDLLSIPQKLYSICKNTILWLLIIVIIGGAFTSTIAIRHITHPIHGVHDIILQQEAAVRALLIGKNPYAITYFGTPMEEWHYADSDKELNPALFHFVMEPFYVLFAIPFYGLGNKTLGFFDARFPLILLFAFLLIGAFLLVKDGEKKRLFVMLLAFHPAMLPYTLEGRSDIFMYSFLFVSLFLLYKKRLLLSALFLAIAFATKQSAWLLFPFYILYIYFSTPTKSVAKRIVHVFYPLIIFVVVFSAIIVPFFLWDQKAFIASTILFLSGMTEHSYPIAGYGFGSALLELGVIHNKFAYFPFVYWQLLFCIPVFIGLVFYLRRRPSIQRLLVSYGVFLLVYWYFSRYFHNSHIAYISILFISAYFWPEEEQKQIHTAKEQRAIHSKTKRRRFIGE